MDIHISPKLYRIAVTIQQAFTSSENIIKILYIFIELINHSAKYIRR